MAVRIGELICRGELDNRQTNSVFGWLDFGNDIGLRIELTGNLSGQFSGQGFRFEVAQFQPYSEEDGQQLEDLETRQIGAVGEVSLRMAKVPVDELRRPDAAKKPIESVEQPCLYIEWFGQNGRVVAEMVNVRVEISSDDGEDASETSGMLPDPCPEAEDGPGETGPQISGFSQNEHGDIEAHHFDSPADEDPDDPYGLFVDDLDRKLAESGDQGNDADTEDESTVEALPRDWADMIPGIDRETKAMYEQWDEILYGTNHDPVATLFDPPLSLPTVDGLTEQEAWQQLNVVLGRLATFCISIDMCEHATAIETYRWLIEEVLPEATFTPASIGSGFVQHYSTLDHCPKCQAEFEDEWAARKEEPRDDDGNRDDV